MSGCGREALPDDREWSGGRNRSPGVVRRPTRVVGRSSRKSGCGREDLPDVSEWSRGPLECPGVVGKPFRMTGSGQEAIPEVRVWSGVHPG